MKEIISPAALRDIRLIVMDLDGTLLTKEKTISPRTVSALKACRDKGILIAFDTGRCAARIAPYADEVGIDAAVVSYGAHILYHGQTIFRRYMSPVTATTIIRASHEAQKLHVLAENGRWYSSSPEEETLPLDRDSMFTYRADRVSAWKLPKDTALRIAQMNLCALTQLIDSDWCNFSPRGTGKGLGAKVLMKKLGIMPGSAIGFGDESCDIEFFRACGTGVAMGNADEMTLQNADYVTESNYCDGIAVFLEKYIL